MQEIRSCRTNDINRRDTKLECERNTRKETDSYLLHVRKLDMEMSPDSLEESMETKLDMAIPPDSLEVNEVQSWCYVNVCSLGW